MRIQCEARQSNGVQLSTNAPNFVRTKYAHAPFDAVVRWASPRCSDRRASELTIKKGVSSAVHRHLLLKNKPARQQACISTQVQSARPGPDAYTSCSVQRTVQSKRGMDRSMDDAAHKMRVRAAQQDAPESNTTADIHVAHWRM